MTDLPLATGEPDLTDCDREPIHIPGAIQPHGLLIAFTDDLRTVAASENLPDFAGLQLGRDPRTADRGTARCRYRQPSAPRRCSIRMAIAGSPVPIRFARRKETEFTGLWHRHDGLIVLEVEAPEHETSESHAFFSRTSGAIRRLQAAQTLEAACAAAAREVREITGFDRVKVYRFGSDLSGQVIAEDRSEGVESYLGLHFPPSDIPAQARKLYAINPVRIIPNIDYHPVPIAPDINPLTGKPIDLSFAALRSVSPIHLEYMRNIGMRGTMSVSILRGDRLWGLIACHNREPKYVGHDSRQACEMVARVLAWQIGVMEEQAITRQTLKGKAIQRSLISDIEQLHDHRAGLARNSEALLELMGASGLCLYGREGATTIGRTPPLAAIEKLANIVGQIRRGRTVPDRSAVDRAARSRGVRRHRQRRSRRAAVANPAAPGDAVVSPGNLADGLLGRQSQQIDECRRRAPATAQLICRMDRGGARSGAALGNARDRGGGRHQGPRHRRHPAQHREARAHQQPACPQQRGAGGVRSRRFPRHQGAASAYRSLRGTAGRIHSRNGRRTSGPDGQRHREVLPPTSQSHQRPGRILATRSTVQTADLDVAR